MSARQTSLVSTNGLLDSHNPSLGELSTCNCLSNKTPIIQGQKGLSLRRALCSREGPL